MSSPNRFIHTRSARTILLQSCPYTACEQLGSDTVCRHSGQAFCLNISAGGMLVLISHSLQVGDLIEFGASTSRDHGGKHRLAEVRWVRSLFDDASDAAMLVGVKFLRAPLGKSTGRRLRSQGVHWHP